MTIVGPPDRKPDTLAPGMAWCDKCGLRQYPKTFGQYVQRAMTACPVCRPSDYRPRVAHLVPPTHARQSNGGDRLWRRRTA